ncbi:MAG: oligosaccharide flippase family protein [Hyphomonas sp.]
MSNFSNGQGTPARSENADASGAPRTAQPSLRKAAVSGMAYAGIQSIAVRVVLLFSQILLGWLLLPDAFGISALAGTIATLAWSFSSFGTDEVLLQRGATIALWEKTVFALSLGASCLAFAVMLAIGPFAAAMFNEPQILLPLALSGAAMVITSMTTVSSVKLRYAMDFKFLAFVTVTQAILLQTLIVCFAFMGFGAMSFFWPVPFVKLYGLTLLWRRSPPNFIGALSLRRTLIFINKSGRVFVSRISQAVLSQADYIVLGLFATTSIVGFYSFAYRLAAVPMRVLGTNLRTVLVPTLTRLKSDKARQSKAAQEAAEMLAYLIMPFCFIVAAVSEPAMRMLFHEKWLASVLILQVLSIGMPMEAILGVARSQLAARGEFTRAMKYDVSCVAVFVIFTIVGGLSGGALGVAIAVSAYNCVVSPIMFFRVFPPENGYVSAYARVFGLPGILSFTAAFIGYLAGQYSGQSMAPIFSCLVIGGVSTLAYVAAIWTLKRSVFNTFLRLGAGFLPRNKQSA